MAVAQAIEKPQRWDLSFSQDLPNVEERREMTDEDIDRLLSMPPFRDMDKGRFPRNLPLREILRNDARIRWYTHGTVAVRQGDYGNSAFVILSGKVRVLLKGINDKVDADLQQVIGRQAGRPRSLVRSIAGLFTSPRLPEVRDASRYPQVQQAPVAQRGDILFVQDVSVVDALPDVFEKTDNATMNAGQMFGELAALGRIPRTATIVADGEAELLEIRWQGLRDLRKFDSALKQHLDEQFRQFGLAVAIRALPLSSPLSDDDVRSVTEAAEFEAYGSFDWFGTYKQMMKQHTDPLKREPIIAEQGHYPNGLVFIRTGFARRSRTHGNGEQTYGYLGKGDIYGLEELAHNARNNDQIPLGSTLRAVGYVDVVRIPTRICEQFILDKLAPDVHPAAGPPPSGDESPTEPRAGAEKIDSAMMEFLVENRFINGTATMLMDMDRCTRCDDCVRACASGHDNNPRFVRHGTIVDHYMVANACMHCADPVCMIGCPTGAIHRSEEGGEVVINDLTCIGCGTCAASCPYENIRMVEIRDRADDRAVMVDPGKSLPILKATKCDLCIDHHGGPACERACPHDALKRVDMKDLNALSRWLNR